ncbi:uncharacterized protein LOC125583105 [Brassica napus]|uniref:uncharacterized protein LOC125583105 n=1 Tax=Brassica napus TaxID=3708 RepID=UPI0020797119|nr:uncharacterized protein LOC125583105 [Brassica napus]
MMLDSHQGFVSKDQYEELPQMVHQEVSATQQDDWSELKKEILKLLDAGVIYPISDSKWVSPVHVVPKKGGITVIKNDKDELIPTRTITGHRMCIDYRKLNSASRKDHFPLPFIDQMLERLANHPFYCFLDGYSGFFQIPIHPNDQEKTTFTCPYGTFAYRRMPFGLCNAPATFQRCMMSIFSDLIEDVVEVFMDDFSVYGSSFSACLSNLCRVLQRCEDTNLVLNWEKCHFMVKEGIVLGHKISEKGIEVDKAKIDVMVGLPPPKTVKDIRSFLGHAGFYRRFIKDFSLEAERQEAERQEFALRGKALPCEPTGSGTQKTVRQQTLAARKSKEQEKRAGKSVAVPNHEESETESADEQAPTKNAKMSKGKGVAVDRDRAKTPSVEELYDHLKNEVTWTPTRMFGLHKKSNQASKLQQDKQRNQRKRQNRFDDDERRVRSGDRPFSKAKRSNCDIFDQNELQTYVSLEKMLHKMANRGTGDGRGRIWGEGMDWTCGGLGYRSDQ